MIISGMSQQASKNQFIFFAQLYKTEVIYYNKQPMGCEAQLTLAEKL